MPIVSAAVPGPWWTLLSYESSTVLPEGVRVRVPLGRSSRVGVIVKSPEEDEKTGGLKRIAEIIDDAPPLAPELWRTVSWFSEMWFAGMGLSLKTLMPAKFLSGESLDSVIYSDSQESAAGVKYVYNPTDSDRRAIYREMIEDSPCGTLALFPEQDSAKSFWQTLPDNLKEEGLLWPASGAEKQWKLWRAARAGEFKFVVGSQGAAMLPLRNLQRIIVEDESSTAWKTQKHPEYHKRSLLAARARNAGAELVLGGRMPSAKARARLKDDEFEKNGLGKRAVFVNIRDAKGFDSRSIKERLPISHPLIRETSAALSAGRWSLWILDRKGYSGEIYCDECGSSVRCANCGGVMRWEEKHERLYCGACGYSGAVPRECPSCGSLFLEGHRPGIEAVSEAAGRLLRNAGTVVMFDDGVKPDELAEKYPSGALVVGTRKIISLADFLSVGAVGWIDADGEARSVEYDAKARAFGMIWESAWRGLSPAERVLVVQSRRPGKGWQAGLTRGWGAFWDEELRERELLGLPPFIPMIKLEVPPAKRKKLAAALSDSGMQFIESDEIPGEIWVRTKRFALFKKLLAPFFQIVNMRSGVPKVTVYVD